MLPTQCRTPQLQSTATRQRQCTSAVAFSSTKVVSKHLTAHARSQQHQEEHIQQYSSTELQQRVGPQLGNSSRRSLLQSAGVYGLATTLGLLTSGVARPKPAQAYIVDEVVAQSVFAVASRSVVSINDYKLQGGAEIFEGVGTGIVWDQYGHIVTNYHCVGKYAVDKTGQQIVKVMVDDGQGTTTPYTAKVIGTDAMHDLAVLQIDAPKSQLVPIRMGTSKDLKVGQSVYAVGNPYGLTKTLTAGVVSGLNRTIPAPTGTRIYGAIQTDASVNAGNSGGPMLDSFARLVGVSTASFTRAGSGRGSGVNFALPADMIREVVPNLIIYGTAAGRGVRSG